MPASPAPPAEILRALWTEALGAPPRDAEADFFGEGGDSFALLELLAAVEGRLGPRIPPELFARAPSFANLLVCCTPEGMVPSTGITLVRPAGRAPAAGCILAMPGYHGIAPPIAAQLGPQVLAGHDILACDMPAPPGESLATEGRWLAVAQALAEQLLAPGAPAPAALLGFSLGANLAWLVERLLVRAGRPPLPVINLDGAALATPAMPELAALLPREAPPTRMLLLHRAPAGRFLMDEAATGWQRLGVAPHCLAWPSVEHGELAIPRTLQAAGPALEAFLAGAPVLPPLAEAEPPAPLGEVLHALLAMGAWTDRAAVAALVAEPEVQKLGTLRPALLVLALIALGQEAALQLARRFLAEYPWSMAAEEECALLAAPLPPPPDGPVLLGTPEALAAALALHHGR